MFILFLVRVMGLERLRRLAPCRLPASATEILTNFSTYEPKECEEEYVYEQPTRKGPGFWTTLFAIIAAFGSVSSKNKQRDTGRCDGDCANCPAHYGYRYGRWYYGHGHQYGCQRGGNGGASGRTYRD